MMEMTVLTHRAVWGVVQQPRSPSDSVPPIRIASSLLPHERRLLPVLPAVRCTHWGVAPGPLSLMCKFPCPKSHWGLCPDSEFFLRSRGWCRGSQDCRAWPYRPLSMVRSPERRTWPPRESERPGPFGDTPAVAHSLGLPSPELPMAAEFPDSKVGRQRLSAAARRASRCRRVTERPLARPRVSTRARVTQASLQEGPGRGD